MPKPKFVKPLLIGVACTIPVGLVVGLSVNWSHTKFISAVGSSGVKPFIEGFGKTYHKQHSQYDVTVESGGTAFAIEQIAKGYTNLGNASNNPYDIIQNEGYTSKWDNKKTFTLGWEGLVIMYSLPELSDNGAKHFDILITSDNILQLYAIFSGWYELKDQQWSKEYQNLWFYHDPACEQYMSSQDIEALKKTSILPFVRSGGNTGANSSIAFTYYSNLADFSQMTEKQQKAFSGGQYGTDGKNMETDESNARAWQSFVAKDKPGSMVYLTTSFLSQDNLDQMSNRGYKLAKVRYGTVDTSVLDENGKLELDNLAKLGGYNWYRPINVMIDLDVQKSKDFLYWIYFGNSQDKEPEFAQTYIKGMKDKGAKPLTVEDFNSMLDMTAQNITDAMFGANASDIELAKTRQAGWQATTYGAIELWKN